jgi:hypothetical protein
VIHPDVTNSLYTAFLAELESLVGARDIVILVGDSHETPELERLLIQRMTSQVAALVLASSGLGDDAIVAATARLPVVLANRMFAETTIAPESRHGKVVTGLLVRDPTGPPRSTSPKETDSPWVWFRFLWEDESCPVSFPLGG